MKPIGVKAIERESLCQLESDVDAAARAVVEGRVGPAKSI
jgi:hypothetical protein